MAKRKENKNRSARERIRQEEKKLGAKYAAMEIEHQKWMDTVNCLQENLLRILGYSIAERKKWRIVISIL